MLIMGVGTYETIRDNFSDVAITKYGASVTYTPVTQTTTGDYGDEVLTDGTPVTITAWITKKSKEWLHKLPGEFEKCDMIMLTKYDQAMNKDDKITYNDGLENRTFRVDYVLNRTAGENKVVYRVCALYLIL